MDHFLSHIRDDTSTHSLSHPFREEWICLIVQQSNFINFRSCIFSCMSQKAELPSLTGHRTKTRKRDEKKVREHF